MALDHFVPQVHRRKFCSPLLDDARLFATRMSDPLGKTFTTTTRAVCRIENSNRNPFLADPGEIEVFLKEFEPAYDIALSDLVAGTISPSTREVLSGFIAGVVVCFRLRLWLAVKRRGLNSAGAV